MAQQYADPRAHERMAAGTCPECGKAPDQHAEETTVLGMFAPCNLLRRGVIDRIERYQRDTLVREVSECTCVTSCAEHPPTACSLSGIPHVHPDDGSGTFGPCPAHPDRPGDH